MSKPSGNRGLIASLGVLSTVVIGAGIAYACTPQASVQGVSPGQGPPSSSTTVTGTNFIPASEGTVEIHWDSSSGPVIGSATGPSFSTGVTIPSSASPGTHTITAVARRSDGGVAGTGAIAFSVTSDAGSSPSGSTSGGSSGAGGKLSGTTTGAPGDSSSGAGSGSGGGSGSGSSAGSGSTGLVTSDAGTPVFAGSVSAEQANTPAASGKSALGDLWAGFRGEATLTGDGNGGVAADNSSGSQLAIGIGLLAVGLLALAGGIAVAAARRSRAEV